jgi:glycosyltransferase involved in cell wall biosynthesis
MRVLQVTSLTSGGPLEHSLVLTRALRRLGATVSAVCASEQIGSRFAAAGAEPHVLPLSSPADLRGGERLRRLARGADVVHAQDRRSGLWTRVWPRRRRQIRVYTVHGVPDPYLPPPVGSPRPGLRDRAAYRGLDSLLARRSDAIVSPSRFLADQLVGRLGYPADRISVIPNGVEPLPPTQAGDLVGTISVLEPVKGLDSFVRAAATIREQRPHTRFAIFGDGTSRSSLESLARSLGLGDALAFPGHVPIADALESLGVYVLCSWLENCPMSLLEAMAAGRPALATRVGGVPEIAGDAVPLVPPGDPAAISREVLALLSSPERAEDAGRRGRERVLARFTAERNATEMLELYERLLSEAR